MKHKKKSTMFTELNATFHTQVNAIEITNANFKKIEKALKKQDDKNFEFAMQIDNLTQHIEHTFSRKKISFYQVRELCRHVSECLTVPAILSIIYYCFK